MTSHTPENLFNRTYAKRHRSIHSHHEITLKKKDISDLIEPENKRDDLIEQLNVMRMDLKQIKLLKNEEFIKQLPKSNRLDKKKIKLIKENSIASQVNSTPRSHRLNISNLTCDFPLQQYVNPYRKTVLLSRKKPEEVDLKLGIFPRLVDEENEKHYRSTSYKDNFSSPISYNKIGKIILKEIGQNNHFERILNKIYRKVVFYSSKNKFVGEQTLVNLIRDEKKQIAKFETNKMMSMYSQEESSFNDESTKHSNNTMTTLNSFKSNQTSSSFYSHAKNQLKSSKLNLKSNLEAIGEFKETESCQQDQLETENKNINAEESKKESLTKMIKFSNFKPTNQTSIDFINHKKESSLIDKKEKIILNESKNNNNNNLPFIKNTRNISSDRLSSEKSKSQIRMNKLASKEGDETLLKNSSSIYSGDKKILPLREGIMNKSKSKLKENHKKINKKSTKFNSDLKNLQTLDYSEDDTNNNNYKNNRNKNSDEISLDNKGESDQDLVEEEKDQIPYYINEDYNHLNKFIISNTQNENIEKSNSNADSTQYLNLKKSENTQRKTKTHFDRISENKEEKNLNLNNINKQGDTNSMNKKILSTIRNSVEIPANKLKMNFDKEMSNEDIQLLLKIQNEYNMYKSRTVDFLVHPENSNLSQKKINKNISRTIEDSTILEENININTINNIKKKKTVVNKKEKSKDFDLNTSQENDIKEIKVKSPKKINASRKSSINSNYSPGISIKAKSPLQKRKQSMKIKINEVSLDSSLKNSEHSHNETEVKHEGETYFHTSEENLALLNKVSQLAKHKKMSLALGKSESIVNLLAKEENKKSEKVTKLYYNQFSKKNSHFDRKETNMTKDFHNLKEKYYVKKQIPMDPDEQLQEELRKKKLLYLYNINQDLNYHMQKPSLTEEEKKRYEEFKEKLDSMNKIASEDYVNFFDQNFHEIKEEMENLQDLRALEERLNSFLGDLFNYRKKNIEVKKLLHKSVKSKSNNMNMITSQLLSKNV